MSGGALTTLPVNLAANFFLRPGSARASPGYACVSNSTIITNPAYSQGQIIHCAGCTMGGSPHRQGAPADQLPNFYHTVLTFSVRLKVTMTTKKSRQLFEKEETPGFAYEKRAPTLRWYGAPRMVNLHSGRAALSG